MINPTNESPTSLMGPRQLYVPRRQLIARLLAAGGAGGTVRAAVVIPDSRILVKWSLVAVPDSAAVAPAAMMAGRACTLWAYGADDDEVQGRPRTPVSDVIPGVTSAAPQAFPLNAGLGGFSREFRTSADAVEVRLVIPVQPANPSSGAIYMQARVQPNDFQIIPWDQWQEIRAACRIDILDGPVTT